MVVKSWRLPGSTATIQASLWQSLFPETTEGWEVPLTTNWSRTYYLQWRKLLACNYPFRQQLGSLLPSSFTHDINSWEHWENYGLWHSGSAFNSTTNATSSWKLWSIPLIFFLSCPSLLCWDGFWLTGYCSPYFCTLPCCTIYLCESSCNTEFV